jgi:Fe-S-cluster containining protein
MKTEPCKNCGLCCEHLLVEANAIDVMREPRIETERPLGKRAVSLSVLDACWILAGPGMPCAFLTPKKRCAIYSSRPQTCVAFVPGSPQCQELRMDAGRAPVVLQPAVHDILAEIMQVALAESREDIGLL